MTTRKNRTADEKRERDARDREILRRAGDALNREAQDILEYQEDKG